MILYKLMLDEEDIMIFPLVTVALFSMACVMPLLICERLSVVSDVKLVLLVTVTLFCSVFNSNNVFKVKTTGVTTLAALVYEPFKTIAGVAPF